jgi:cytidylate kinase
VKKRRSSDCFVVAIDGPSGAGKSTVARRVAERLQFHFLDSGALYRALALAVLEAGLDPLDSAALDALLARVRVELDDDGRVLLDGRDVAGRIRTEEVSQAASKLSSLPAVREALIALQRTAARAPGTVAEGRDMGTVVFPDAPLKIFLDAEVAERARRRAEELQRRGENVDLEAVRAEMIQRDLRDRTREVAPLRAAPDAMIVDSTALTADEVVETIVAEASRRGRARSTTD